VFLQALLIIALALLIALAMIGGGAKGLIVLFAILWGCVAVPLLIIYALLRWIIYGNQPVSDE